DLRGLHRKPAIRTIHKCAAHNAVVIHNPAELEALPQQLSRREPRALQKPAPLKLIVTKQRIAAQSVADFSAQIESMFTERKCAGAIGVPFRVTFVGAQIRAGLIYTGTAAPARARKVNAVELIEQHPQRVRTRADTRISARKKLGPGIQTRLYHARQNSATHFAVMIAAPPEIYTGNG